MDAGTRPVSPSGMVLLVSLAVTGCTFDAAALRALVDGSMPSASDAPACLSDLCASPAGTDAGATPTDRPIPAPDGAIEDRPGPAPDTTAADRADVGADAAAGSGGGAGGTGGTAGTGGTGGTDAAADGATGGDQPCSTAGGSCIIHAGHRYTFFTDYKSWQAARDACVNGGLGHLVTIDDAEENAWLLGAINGGQAGTPLQVYWIGLNDLAKADQWVWADGSSSGYRNWGPVAPVANPSDACVRLYRMFIPEANDPGYPRAGQWHNVQCDIVYTGFICEK